ncbi:Oxysterol-binding protein 1 [Temnothorax longispinosus]|uniref:Oxysterol-binding protein 1 n=1 Tax=Temnothorax longispinosus TaxID=300112 RepID=A0A4S2K9E7_9HYME|nr:Oxysterol-binding protein 1 [Temnothorax longispinosus]
MVAREVRGTRAQLREADDGSMGDPKSQHGAQEMKGWLFKWTNYLKGYQRRWFVLSNGLLSYYR